MKYDKSLLLWVSLGVAVGLAACSTGGDKRYVITGADVEPDLVSTQEYLPVQESDDEGQWLPYEPSDNPYASQRGRVDRESVVTYIEARRAFKAERFEQAKGLLEGLIAEEPDLSGPRVLLGDIAVEEGDHEAAVQAYLKAIDINGENVNAYLRLARAQRLMGRFLHAQNTYAQALAVWPDFPEAHLNLAVLYDVYLNHPLRAQKHMEAYEFLSDGKNEEVAGWLAEIRRRTGIAPSFHADSQGQPSEPLSYSADQKDTATN